MRIWSWSVCFISLTWRWSQEGSSQSYASIKEEKNWLGQYMLIMCGKMVNKCHPNCYLLLSMEKHILSGLCWLVWLLPTRRIKMVILGARIREVDVLRIILSLLWCSDIKGRKDLYLRLIQMKETTIFPFWNVTLLLVEVVVQFELNLQNHKFKTYFVSTNNACSCNCKYFWGGFLRVYMRNTYSKCFTMSKYSQLSWLRAIITEQLLFY